MTGTLERKARGGRRPSEDVAPPDGGWGWMIVVGCFITTICTRAVTRCVSIFFVEFQLHFERDYATTAWIHSLVDSTTMLCAPLGSWIGNRLSCRATVMLGGLLSSTGLVLSSFATSLEYLYGSLGVLTGLGFALCYTPAIAMVGRYFSEKKALAYGIAMSGSGIGTFILAPVVQVLIEFYSWRGALLILGGFAANLCVCGALMRPLEPKRGRNRRQDDSVGALERGGYVPTPLNSNDFDKVPVDCRQSKPKLLDLASPGASALHLANVALETSKLESGEKLAEALLSPGKLSLPWLTDVKFAEGVSVSNSKLTEKILAEINLSDAKRGNGGTLEDMKLVETLSYNKLAADTKLTDPSRLIDKKPADIKQSLMESNGKTETPVSAPAPFVNLSKGSCFRRQSMEEFGFLLMPDFLLLSVSFMFLAYGCSVPIVYLVPYAMSVGVDYQQAAFLMSIFGVVDIVGNITFGWLTDRKCLKKYRMLSYMLAVGMEGLCCMFLPLLRSFALLVPFAMLYGYFDGAYVALIPVVTSDVVGPTYLASALGVVYFLHAIPYLISPPIGGWLVDNTGDYTASFFVSGLSLMSSPLFLTIAMLVRRCWRTKSYSADDLDTKFQSLKNGPEDLHKASPEEPKLKETP